MIVLAGWISLLLSSGLLAQQSELQKLQAGDFQGAANEAKSALKDHPNESALWNVLAIAQSELGEIDAARQSFQRGLQIAPRALPLLENFGLFYFKRREYTQAEKYLGRAVALGSTQAGVRFSYAAALIRTGESNKALTLLVPLEGALGESADYWLERARAVQSDAPRALPSYRRALALAPQNVEALVETAACLSREGQHEEALAMLLRARQLSPDNPAVLVQLGEICIQQDLGPDAISSLERALQLQPDNSLALYLLARAHIATGEWQTAHELFERYRKLDPSWPATYYALGWLDEKLNRPDQARLEVSEAVRRAPQWADARYELGQLQLQGGEQDLARQSFVTALKIDGKHPGANLALGSMLLREGRLDEAQVLLQRAVQSDSKLAAAHYQLAALYRRKNDVSKAAEEQVLASTLTQEEKAASKTQLRLAVPSEKPR